MNPYAISSTDFATFAKVSEEEEEAEEAEEEEEEEEEDEEAGVDDTLSLISFERASKATSVAATSSG